MHKSLTKLIEGNKRFAKGESLHPNLGVELRNSLVNKQKPFAAIIACSDSRVPVEIIFDVGLGDLFVIRSAGHVLSKEAIGSLEYAVSSLDVKFVMILGHDNCGAVTSALSTYNSKENDLTENLSILLNHIYPVFENLDTKSENALNKAITLNINYQVKDLLKRSDYLTKKVQKNELLVVGGKYSLESGLVEVID